MNFNQLNRLMNSLERITYSATEEECNDLYELIRAEYSRVMYKMDSGDCEHMERRFTDADYLIQTRFKQEKESEDEAENDGQ